MTEVEVSQLRLDKRGRPNWKKTEKPFRGRPKSKKIEASQNDDTLDFGSHQNLRG